MIPEEMKPPNAEPSAKSEETQPKDSPQEERQVRASFARVARGRLDSLQNDFLPDTLQPSDFLHLCAPAPTERRTRDDKSRKMKYTEKYGFMDFRIVLDLLIAC